jgi:hypothetical protein
VHSNIGLGETRRADLVSDWHVARLRSGKFCVDCATEKFADSVLIALSLSSGRWVAILGTQPPARRRYAHIFLRGELRHPWAH